MPSVIAPDEVCFQGSAFWNCCSSEWCEHRPTEVRIEVAAVSCRDQKLLTCRGFSRSSKSDHHRDTQSFPSVILRSFDSIIDEDICSFCRASACGQLAIRRDDANPGNGPGSMKLHPVPARQRLCIDGCHCRHHEIVHWLNLPASWQCTSQLLVRAAQLQVMSRSRDVMCDCAQPIT